jgi:hypothetical protein
MSPAKQAGWLVDCYRIRLDDEYERRAMSECFQSCWHLVQLSRLPSYMGCVATHPFSCQTGPAMAITVCSSELQGNTIQELHRDALVSVLPAVKR